MNLPNKLTLLRVILIPFFCFFLLTEVAGPYSDYIALVIFIIASLTDFADGKIARKYNLVTNFGKFMDPVADKLLVCCALICLLALGRINTIAVIIIIARDFIINGFRLVASDNGRVIAADKWGKYKTATQMLAVCMMIANIEVLSIATIVVTWLAVALTVISLIDCLVKNADVMKEKK